MTDNQKDALFIVIIVVAVPILALGFLWLVVR